MGGWTGCCYGMGCYLGTYHSIGSWLLCSWGDIDISYWIIIPMARTAPRETRHEGAAINNGEYKAGL